MPTPMRLTAGFTQDNPTQPLANMGAPDPFFLNTFQTDFDTVPTGMWTISGSATASVTPVAGDGGLVQLSTTATGASGNFVWAQAGVGSFTSPTSAKRMFFSARLATNVVASNVIYAGAMAVSAPTTWPATAPDGIYFYLQAGILACRTVVSGVVTGSANVPTTALALANAAYFDVGFEVTTQGEVKVFAGTNLFGFRPQSGTATQTTPPPAGGPVARFKPTSFPTINMAPTMAVETTTTTNPTLNADFILVSKER